MQEGIQNLESGSNQLRYQKGKNGQTAFDNYTVSGGLEENRSSPLCIGIAR
jgi:hypothetical protein